MSRNIKHSKANALKLKSIYWDIDDVVLNSLETAVSLINQKYNIPNNLPVKSTADIKDWNMTSIYKDLTPEQIESLFESPEFWNAIALKPSFLSCLTRPILTKYNHAFVSIGTQTNLELKRDFLTTNFPHFDLFEFYGLLPNTSKNQIDMSDGILIDDNISNLIDSNAAIKILLTNDLSTVYNNVFGDYANENIHEIYIVDTLEQVKDSLEFNLKHNLITLE